MLKSKYCYIQMNIVTVDLGIVIFTIQYKNKMAYTAKDPRPPMAFSVPNRNVLWPNRNNKLEGGRKLLKCPSEDPRYRKGRG